MSTAKPLHFNVSAEVRALIREAAAAKPHAITGFTVKLKDWAVPILVRESLRELGYKSLEDWVDSRKAA